MAQRVMVLRRNLQIVSIAHDLISIYVDIHGYGVTVSDENNETLSLGRKNGLRFRKMIMKEMEEVLRNDEEDFDNET
ncbi:hypothetical protein Tco_1021313 [Tanacetum coccineum]